MAKKKKILVLFGTRPEALKLAPLIYALRKIKSFQVFVCVTGQHRTMLSQAVRFFRIPVHENLKLMRQNQTLSYLTSSIMKHFGRLAETYRPDLVIVQGDTTTAFLVSLASFYHRIPVAHIEAGLRTRDKYRPFPEEINRRLITHIADLHFAPTTIAADHLAMEGVLRSNIYCVGNTIVDTIGLAKPFVHSSYPVFRNIDLKKRIIFVTAHRRESFGAGMNGIFRALKQIVRRFQNTEIVYPVHLNPNVRNSALKTLTNEPRLHLLRPLSYEETYWLLEQAYLVLTDSGGIQEEAPSFRKPVLVLREVTERPEGVKAGLAKVVGTKTNTIVNAAAKLLQSKAAYRRMTSSKNPYGDGHASGRIVHILLKRMKALS